MKKHSAWQKDRNRVRRLDREVKAIIRRDDARAEWFNSRFAEMQNKARVLGFMDVWYIDGKYPKSDWPSLDDMFIEVSDDNRLSTHENGGVPAGRLPPAAGLPLRAQPGHAHRPAAQPGEICHR